MSKSIFANLWVRLLALVTATFSLAAPGIKAFAAEPVGRAAPAAPDPYPLSDTLLWKLAGAEIRWYVEKPGGITSVSPKRQSLTASVPEYVFAQLEVGAH